MGMFDDLDNEVESAEAWVAEPDDKLVGRVLKIDTREGGYGEYPIATVEVESGTVGGKKIATPATLAVHMMATVLKSEVGWENEPGTGERRGRWTEDRNLYVGCKVGLKYLGKRTGRDYTYDAWRVLVEPAPTVSEKLDDEELFS